MENFRIKIKLKSNLFTPIKGDTLFGLLCWQLRYLDGETVLEEILNNFEKEPEFIVSSAFPAGYIPCPGMEIKKTTNSHLSMNDLKKLKKLKHIPLSLFKKWRQNFDFDKMIPEIMDFIKNDKLHEKTKPAFIPHNSISRLSGMVSEEGGLHFAEAVMPKGQELDIYLSVTKARLTQLKKAFANLGELGFGRDSSTGGGAFEILGFEKTDLLELKNEHNYAIALSPFIPEKNDPSDIKYDLFTRFGRTGPEIGGDNFFKVPLAMMDSGAFIGNCKKNYVGQLMADVHPDKRIRHSALAPVIGVTVP